MNLDGANGADTNRHKWNTTGNRSTLARHRVIPRGRYVVRSFPSTTMRKVLRTICRSSDNDRCFT